jgi:glucans biosynthesis protein C
MGLAPMVEGPVLVLGTLACCFVGYELVRRVALLRPLFGLKQERRESRALLSESR